MVGGGGGREGGGGGGGRKLKLVLFARNITYKTFQKGI